MPTSHYDVPLNTPLFGYISHWNDAKGYGFIHQSTTDKGVFFHISSFPYHHHRPRKGEAVCFIAQEQDGRYSAKRVVLAQDANKLDWDKQHIIDHQHTYSSWGEISIFVLIALFFLGVLAIISPTLALTSTIISILTFILYAIDKHSAIKQSQRVPEASLHFAALLGGWPGALIARPLLNHKTKKQRFIIFFWMSVVVNFFALYALIIYLPIMLDPHNPFFELLHKF